MSQVFQRLERVLQLEKSQGFQNTAVVGGIRQFAIYWLEQARREALDDQEHFLVEQVGETLSNYNRLPGTEARARAIETLLEQLQQRALRLRKQQPADRPATSIRVEALPPAPPPPTPTPPAPMPVRSETPAPAPVALPAPPPPSRPPVAPDPAGLAQPVEQLRGVGVRLAELLNKLGVFTIQDALYLTPRRYDDFTLLKPIHRLRPGEIVTIIGTIWDVRARRTRTNTLALHAVITDGTGKIQATWFNQPWLTNKLKVGMQIVLSGKVEQYLGHLTLHAPEWEPLSEELLKTNRIMPVYPLTKGLSSSRIRQIMRDAVEEWSPRMPDPLPESIRIRRELLALPEALQQVHFPDSQNSLRQARQRLMFDELLLLQLGMLTQRREWRENPALPLPAGPDLLPRFMAALPYQLTGAQQRVIGEIIADIGRDLPMTRLLQGDVGSGKTVVAAAAMVTAAAAGAQAALMAPTEILAEQHFKSLQALLAPLEVSVRLLTGSTPAAVREALAEELLSGQAQVVIGTHALIQPAVMFQRLGLVVVDEQHRFGVDQRKALRDKGPAGHSPHLLAMSATPIPRTLALSLYGDLDLSVLDEMPPGRQEIKTRWLRSHERERAYAFVRGQIEKGRQAYIICPLVEESDSLDEKAAVAEHHRLQTQVFPDLRLGLLHGRMKPADKEAVMHDFYDGNIHILVSTTVVEVGVDVPNSTVVLVEGADRFGLAQLHQLRGRVGRGEHASYCLLVADSVQNDSLERLRALEQTNDGFLLAEKDLELRGPGEFFGRRQSGLPELRLASLLDAPLLEMARAEAWRMWEEDPNLQQPEHQALRAQVTRFWESAADIS